MLRAMSALVGLLLGMSVFAGLGDAHVLGVPYRSQLDGSPYAQANCGPTALAMVLAYYGIDESLWNVRVQAMKAQRSWVDDEGGYSHRYGVFVDNLALVGESFGLRAVGLWRREGKRLDRLYEWRMSDLRQQIGAGRPVIVQVHYRSLPGNQDSSYREDHYVVVHGTVESKFVYSDPLDVNGGGSDLTIDEADLLRAMSAASSPRAGFALARSGK
jgi:uncharacterized protein YvpB